MWHVNLAFTLTSLHATTRSADSEFAGLDQDKASPGAALQDSSASLQRCTFTNITGPDPCAVVSIAGGGLLLQQTSMRRDVLPAGSAPVCVSGTGSAVFTDRAVTVHNLTAAAAVVPQTVDSVAGRSPAFLSPATPAFLRLSQV